MEDKKSEFFFEFKRVVSYGNSFNKALKFNFLISLCFAFLILLFVNWQLSITIAVFSFVVQFFKSKSDNKYFITLLHIKNGMLYIDYELEGKPLNENGRIRDFHLKKKTTISRARIPYLAIYYKNSVLIEQFVNADWTEQKMDEVINVTQTIIENENAN